MTERDTQFKGTAKLFVDGTQVLGFKTRAEFETYVAQFLYDWTVYITESLSYNDYDVAENKRDLVAYISDLTEWPQNS